MNRLFQLSILLLALLFTSYTQAQRDTVFWFAAPDVSAGAGQSPLFLRLQTYDLPATITLSQPANGAFVPMTLSLAANSNGSIDLTSVIAQIESPAGDVVSNNGLKITATAPINAEFHVFATANKERFVLKGRKALGTDFYVPMQKSWNNAATTPASHSGIEIVASENNTTVLITPRTAIVGHAINATFSVTLNAGQTYSARDVNVSAASSLAGSIVSSNKPVAITIFDGSLSQGACNDLIGDQLVPTSQVGTDYAVYRGTTMLDKVFIMATENGTSVEITGAAANTFVLSSGETHILNLTEELVSIKSTKPVYVYHVSALNCELSSSLVPSLNCKGNNIVNFSRTSSDSLGLILVTRAGFEGDFYLNGSNSLITGADFITVPGTAGVYRAALKFFSVSDIPVGSHNVLSNTADIFTMGMFSGGGVNTGADYSFVSEFSASAYSDAGLDDTVCANISYVLNGNVGGGAIAGVWSTNGYGSFQNPNSSIVNTYIPSPLDTLVSPIRLILSTSGNCPVAKDTLLLVVSPSPMVNANTDQSVCINNSLVDLNGIITGGASAGTWSTSGTGTFIPNSSTLNAQYVPSQADLTAGNINFTLTSANVSSCANVSDIMNVVFTNAATVNAGADSMLVCSNNANVTLSGSISGPTTTGKWTSSGTGMFSPNNSSLNCTYIPSIADTTAGFVWLYLESTSNGNCLPVYDSIYVQISDAPKVDAGINQLICANISQVQLNGSVNGNFGVTWSGGTGTFSPSNTSLNPIYTPSAADYSSGSILLTLTSTNNGTCIQSIDPMQINFVAPPYANFSSTSVCEGEMTSFTNLSLPGSGTINSWAWNFEPGQTSSVQNPTYTYASNGSYPVELIVSTTNGCKDTIVINSLVFDKPTANFTSVNSCPNNQLTVAFTDASTSSDVINYWFYDFGGQGSGAFANLTQVFNTSGTYSITHIVSTVNGCSDTLVTPINLDPLPDAGFFYNTSSGMNVGAVFNFIDTSDFAINYHWNFGDGNTSTSMNPTHTYYANGNYYVLLKVENNLGCIDSAFRFISINSVTNEISTLIPTVISPNGDGLNDVWKLDFIKLLYPNAHIEIYNEWGQTIFTSDGYDKPWDGTYNNEPVPDGNYMYIIQLNADADPDLFKGVLMVLRKRG